MIRRPHLSRFFFAKWWRARRAEQLRRRRVAYEKAFTSLQRLYPWAPEWLLHQCLSDVPSVRVEGWETLNAQSSERRFQALMAHAAREPQRGGTA